MSEVSNLQTSPNSKKQPHFWGTFGELKLKKALQISVTPFSAESEGFEPPDPLRSTVFKTAAFDHSANSPRCFRVGILSRWSHFLLLRDCKGTNNFETCKFFLHFFVFFLKDSSTSSE